MNQKHKQNIYHATVNVNLTLQNAIWVRNESTKNVDVSAKIQENIICVKKIISGIQVHVFVKMAKV